MQIVWLPLSETVTVCLKFVCAYFFHQLGKLSNWSSRAGAQNLSYLFKFRVLNYIKHVYVSYCTLPNHVSYSTEWCFFKNTVANIVISLSLYYYNINWYWYYNSSRITLFFSLSAWTFFWLEQISHCWLKRSSISSIMLINMIDWALFFVKTLAILKLRTKKSNFDDFK